MEIFSIIPQRLDTGASPTWVGATLSGLTAGSVLFAGTGGVLSQDNSDLSWNDTDKSLRLGDGIEASPSYAFTSDTGTGFWFSPAGTDKLVGSKGGIYRQSWGGTTGDSGFTQINYYSPSSFDLTDGYNISFITLGSTYTETGAWKPNGCEFGANNEMSGGFSISATHADAHIRFYTGGRADGDLKLIIRNGGNIGIGESAPETLTEWTGTAPYLTLHNSTHEDTDGGRESRLTFKGEQSGGEEKTLARVEVGHDGTGDDEKGYIDGYTNSGSDGDSPTKQIRIQSTGDWVINKTSGIGIKVDVATPTFGWADLQAEPSGINTGATKPTQATYRDTLKQYQFAAGDEEYYEYHIPHDYVPGTDVHVHVHWSHTGTFVTGGTITFTVESSYAKGHNQAPFPASVSGDFNGTASTTQYQHIVSETQLSASSPAGLQIDTDDLEPDGIVIMRVLVKTNGMTVSEGAVPDPFIHHVDIHYQTTGLIGTKQKAPDFYT